MIIRMDIHFYKYDVIILDDIDKRFVRRALSYIPGFFHFRIIDSNDYSWKTIGGYEYAWPDNKDTIVIFDALKHNHKQSTPTGYHLWDGRSTIAMKGHTEYSLGWLIMHECLHGILKRIDIDRQGTYIDGLKKWYKNVLMGDYDTKSAGIGHITLRFHYLINCAMDEIMR